MHSIEMQEVTPEFAEVWKVAGLHLDKQVQGESSFGSKQISPLHFWNTFPSALVISYFLFVLKTLMVVLKVLLELEVYLQLRMETMDTLA